LDWTLAARSGAAYQSTAHQIRPSTTRKTLLYILAVMPAGYVATASRGIVMPTCYLFNIYFIDFQ
jgi:hypothetical protein